MKWVVAVAVASLLLLVATAAGQTVDSDGTLTAVEVDGDGDADFVLEHRMTLDTEDERQAFDDLAAEVDSDPESFLTPYREAMTELVERAANDTGREMNATGFEVDTHTESLPRERGVVEYRFRWRGFADVDGDRLRVTDVLEGYMLGEGDSLVVRYPSDREVVDVGPEPDSTEGDGVRWDGPRDFPEGEPAVSVDSADNASDGNDDNGDGVDGGGDAGDRSPSYLLVTALVVVAALALGGVATYLYRRDTEEDEELDVESVPDDDRVLDLVESAGGQMKQKKVVEETGWSEAKVSQVTSRLEEDGRMTKLRMGRENVLRLPEEEE
ncbi:MAG: helix-turn-helix transcriptional regulator [Halobacteriales archaeon]